MDDMDRVDRELSIAFQLGCLRGEIQVMPEGETKRAYIHVFTDALARSGLDVMTPGPLRDAFLRGMEKGRRSGTGGRGRGPNPGTPQPKKPGTPQPKKPEPKRLAYFADGTRNGFEIDPEGKRTGCDATNVLKLFQCLDGAEWRDRREAERVLVEPGLFGRRQAAKYLHGVGNDDNPLVSCLRGMTGSGLLERLIRGYTFLSRHYEPGAQIVLVGFSRGAYTVRALADWIAVKGLLDAGQFDATDKMRQYQLAAASLTAWQRYRANQFSMLMAEKQVPFRFHHGFGTMLAALPSFFRDPEPAYEPVQVRCVAVWDTVGSLGLWLPVPALLRSALRGSAMRRPDTILLTTPVLHEKVREARHAVSLDEDRVDFTPSLWHPREGVVQRLFPGVHSDVGGGYPQCGLSDIALQWMHAKLQDLLLFRAPPPVAPDALATGHRGWDTFVGALALRATRSFGSRQDLEVDEAVLARMGASTVQAHPRAQRQPYRPPNLPAYQREGDGQVTA